MNITGSLYHYKKPIEPKTDNAIDNLSVNDSSSFKYQLDLIKKQVNLTNVEQNRDPDVANAHRLWKNVKIAVSLKYISNFFRSLELPLINTKLYFELIWTKHSVVSDAGAATNFQITKTGLYVPVVSLSNQNKNNKKSLNKLLEKSFKRSVIWNEYKTKIQTITQNDNNFKRILLDSSSLGVNRNFYDQNINDSITIYNELLKLSTEKSEAYTTGCLIDCDYYVKDYTIATADLSHQAVLDSDPKAIQQIEFIYKILNSVQAQILTVLEKEKETILKFSRGTVKVY